MASLVSVREEQKIPLLQSHRDSITAAEDEEEEILPSSSPFNHHQLPPPPPQAEYHCKRGPTPTNQRLVSLDVFRGLTVAVHDSI